MALIKMKPTSPGARFVVKIDRSHLHKGGPLESLTVKKNRTGARNHSGRQTTRHIGGGHKQRYRLVDFKRDKDGIPGVVERLEYDPNRTSHLALVLYKDGERRYILAPKGVKAGDEIRSGADAPIKAGNAMPLRHIPAKCARCTWIVARPSAKSATTSIICACSARPARCVGWACVPRFAASS
jgi:large subunit ribosomal protein L2